MVERNVEQGDGAVPGEYQVKITKVEVTTTSADPPDEDVRPETERRSLIPERYGDFNTSELSATIAEGQPNDFEFELTD
jgi:hypothetical protein